MKTIALILLVSGYALHTTGQDTVDIRPFERYWTQPRLVPKVGFGLQETAFGELGVQFHQIYVHPLSLASAGPYISVEGVFEKYSFIMGTKAGYEITAGLLGVAADFTYYTDFDRESVVFTPKAGLTVLGFVDLFYGRNITLSDDTFKSISKNRFSLIFNINPDYFNIKSAGKKSDKAMRR
ncbi:MAG: hypothetical protein ACOYXT_21585 [Bacteroidota bacterium]